MKLNIGDKVQVNIPSMYGSGWAKTLAHGVVVGIMDDMLKVRVGALSGSSWFPVNVVMDVK